MNQISQTRRGGPLAMLGLVLAVWISGRAMLWESPFAVAEALANSVEALIAEAPSSEDFIGQVEASAPATFATARPALDNGLGVSRIERSAVTQLRAEDLFSSRAGIAAGHQMLMMAAMSYLPLPRVLEEEWALPAGPNPLLQDAPGAGWSLPAGAKADGSDAKPDRWSVDAWAFWRQGSNSALISQGRVPVYGASQAGAVLQYRAAPSSRFDPRIYARGYRALVSNGESEGALGVSARPIGAVPLRLHGEVRATDGTSDLEVRGAAFATTEIAPVALPLGAKAEVYAQGGYVSGDAATAFVDGQLQVTREVAQFDLAQSNTRSKSARLSVGGGAWAGFQGAGAAQDVHRVDLGPTARVDLQIGGVPARISVDWRERVAGDAAPSSGVAATISTRF